jgi:thiamine pyrophosphate-dependent acetolactate synthase large subunit-like protein
MLFGTVAASLTCCSTTKRVPTSESVASLVSRCLRAVGATRAFAAPGHDLESLEGLALIPVATEAAAIALADADGRLSIAPDARPGVALLPGRRVRLSSQPGEETQALSIGVEDLPAAFAGWSLGRVFGAVEIELPADLFAEAPEGTQPLVLQRSDQLLRLSVGLADFRTMIIVGPGVLRDGAAADVADFVTRTGAGVMTTMGAIGVVPFDHPSWCGVVGIQVDDPALGGLDACELVIAVGVDDEELGESIPMNAQLLEVEPWHLPFLATDWPAIESIAAPSSLVEACAAVFGDHREATGSPLHPVRAVLDVFDAIDPDVQVYVDSGPAGFWFARGVVPVPIGRVVVPARAADGFAISAAIVSALDGTRSVAITMPGSSLENELLDLAASLDLGIVVEQWGDDVDGGDPSQHRANLVAAMSDSGLSVTGVSVDLAAAAELVDLAGPVVAWPTFN